MADSGDPAFEELLAFIRDSRHFDFTGYKRASLMRRIDKQMQRVGVPDYEAYLDRLQVDPDEFTELFNYILINVTSFFRDPQVWEKVRDTVVPDIVSRKTEDEPIRMWSAGCASGEETYSIAILLAEALGEKAFAKRVKIYGTDVDEEALAIARAGSYSETQLEPLTDSQRHRFFEETSNGYVFRRDLRRALIFGRHDLVQDAPISRTDMIVCRNTLMYLNSEVQTVVMRRFLFSLRPFAYLVLGKSEMLFTKAIGLSPIELKARIFVRDAEREATAMQRPADRGENELGSRAAFENAPVAQLVIAPDGRLALANRMMREQFGLRDGDVGRPLQDLEISYRPVELRSVIERVRQEGGAVDQHGVSARTVGGSTAAIDVRVSELRERGQPVGVLVAFTDVSQAQELQTELESSNQELETAMEELQSSNEELETTNEELQSSNEELETTNEELQSTNEELETMNEELQSANEELETVNTELGERESDLGRLNDFLDSILSGIRNSVIVLDGDLRIRMWNAHSEELWGLRADEVLNQPLLNLDIGLPLIEIRRLLTDGKDGDRTSIEVDATTRRGKRVRCSVTRSPLISDGVENGVVLSIEEMDR